MLGSAISLAMSGSSDVYLGYNHTGVSTGMGTPVSIDVADEQSVTRVVLVSQPTVVIHCAAETDVERCERDPNHAFQVNVLGTQYLAKAAPSAKFIYISTDSVFDGERGLYSESDEPGPLNVYAQTKLAGEQVAREHCEDCLVVRTNIFGTGTASRSSLADWALEKAAQGESMIGFCDVYFSPLFVGDLAQMILRSVNRDIQGLLHAGSQNRWSKMQFLRGMLSEFGFDQTLVRQGRSDGAVFLASRPKDTSLDTQMISRVLELEMPTVQEGLVNFHRCKCPGSGLKGTRSAVGEL